MEDGRILRHFSIKLPKNLIPGERDATNIIVQEHVIMKRQNGYDKMIDLKIRKPHHGRVKPW